MNHHYVASSSLTPIILKLSNTPTMHYISQAQLLKQIYAESQYKTK